jgi:Common central domain of tyrosinase/Bacterial Ig domain
MSRCILPLAIVFLAAALASAPAQTVYMQDTPADTGAQPNPDTGPMWVSQDIWVRNSPDPGYQPYPFTASSPPWTIPPHQNPVYRDPLKSTPNYVYVRVRNDSGAASSGAERLRLYWAKASTGLSWPSQWVDYQPGGPLTMLYGAEITKPRKNGATASAAEQSAYVQAILHIGTNPAYVFPMGMDYWHTQQELHDEMGTFSNIHNTLAFLPWHREFINRYELLLQQYDPTVKLLYWDWTTPPTPSLSFMGSFVGSSIGAPFNPSAGMTLAPPAVSRTISGTPPAESDSAVVARNPYDPFASYSCPPPASAHFMAALEDCSHNFSHNYIGGNSMCCPAKSAQDPFFFMLHGEVDRLWAQWQRNPSDLSRLDPTQTYGASLASDTNLSLTMSPWDGSLGSASGSASSTKIQPWETTTSAPSGGNYVVAKPPTDPSVVSPPIYDTAPLTIPVLQPGQAVVMQIPWYPPNPDNFTSFGSDKGHFCLLARIETSATAPFGMTFPETADVNANTKNNNKIVWKNVTVVDDMSGAMMIKSVIMRNIFDEPVQAGLRVAEARTAAGSFLKQGRIFVDVTPQLFERWQKGGDAGRSIRAADEEKAGRIEILSPDATIQNIRLNPNESVAVNVEFALSKDYTPQQEAAAQVDLIQLGAPGDPDKIVGGQRFSVDLGKLVLVKSGDKWRYWDAGTNPAGAWMSLDYDDSKWRLGAAPFGSGGNTATTINVGPADRRNVTTYFRSTFDIADPSFYRNALLRLTRADSAIIYLNGSEVYRVNLPARAVNPGTTATRAVTGLEREVFFPVKIDPTKLKRGPNVLAVETHANSPRNPNIRFDLELLANVAGGGFPPDVAFASPPDAAVFQAGEIVPVQLEALSGDAKIASVSLYTDGRLIGTAERAPYTFTWPAGPDGAHRLRAVAVDNLKKQSESFHTITVVDKVLPQVQLVAPRSLTMSEATEGEAISVRAEATDRTGKIARVEFWAKDMATWVSPSVLVATVTAPPYTASIKDLKAGEYMVWAIAVNDSGGTTQSVPTHVMINARK